MKNSYDYTKDEKYKSYEKLIYDSLIKLGFRITNVGTMYLKDLILCAYFNNYYEINVSKLVKDYMKYKKIDYISYKTFINCIDYSIKNLDYTKMKIYFRIIFDITYDSYYFSTKNILLLFLNIIKKTSTTFL